MLTIEDWIDEQAAPTERAFLIGDGIHQETSRALKDYLHEKTSPDEAARALVAPIFAGLNPKDKLFGVWSVLTDTLVEFENERDKIYRLIPSMQRLPSRDGIKFETLGGLYNAWFEEYTHGFGLEFWELKDSPNSVERVTMLREYHQAIGTAEAGMLTRNLGDQNIWLYWGLKALNLVLSHNWRSLDIWIGKIHGLIVGVGDELYKGLETIDDSSYITRGKGETAGIT